MSYESMFCTYCLCNIENNKNRIGNFCCQEHREIFKQEKSQESGSLTNYFDESRHNRKKSKKGGLAFPYLDEI